MKKLQLLVLRRDARAVVGLLGRMGAIQLSRPVDAAGALPPVIERAEGDMARVRALRARLEVIISGMGLAAGKAEPPRSFGGIDIVEHDIDRIETAVSAWLDELRQLDADIASLDALRRETESFAPFDMPVEYINNLSFLHFAVGTLPEPALPELIESANANVVLLPGGGGQPGRRHLIAATTRKDRWALQTALDAAGFKADTPGPDVKGLPAQILERAGQQIEALRRRKQTIEHTLNETIGAEGPRLLQYRERLRLEERLLDTERLFDTTWSSVLIAGWVPETDLHRVLDATLEATGGKAVIEVLDADTLRRHGEDVPVKLRNHPLVRPFEMFVRGMGVPGYTEIEPTIFVAITFLTMFGLMFGDVGQGGVIALVGVAVHVTGRRRGAIAWQDIGTLGILAGLASMAFGFVYGSLFGLPEPYNPLTPLWFEPMHAPMRILAATVLLGTLIISTGIALNIVNRFRAGDYRAGLLGQFGVAGIVFYWAALLLGIKTIVTGANSAWTGSLLGVMALALLGLMLREPIVALLTRRRPLFERGASGLFESAAETMKVAISYLANTISFVRVGAFALAHGALGIAVFSIAAVLRGLPGGAAWSIAAFVFGNVLVIALEGLIVMVQVTRLEYYEFFNKFMSGSGTPFEPFELK